MKLKNLGKLILITGIFSYLYLPIDLWGQCGNGSFAVLHYTETSGYNHNTRNQSLAMFQAMGLSNNFSVVNDDTGDEFNSLAKLQEYAVVIFSNTSGDNILNASQRANFEAYIQGGGSYVGIHAASDTYRHSTANGNRTGGWDWYAENVVGCSVQQNPNHTSSNHSNEMTHRLPGHPVLAGIPDPWKKTEEYYYWENGYRNSTFTEILRVKQTGGARYDIPRMTTQIKVLPWGGRAFYTALGHSQTDFTNGQEFISLLTNAVNWAAAPNVSSGGNGLSITGILRDASCGMSNGAIDITVSGGSGNYTYLWPNRILKEDLINVPAGTYTVQVNDGNGCTDSETFTVGSASIKPQLSLDIDQEISCYDSHDGAISSTVIGNSRTYSYLWNSGKISANLTGVGAGFHELIVTTPAGCKDTASVILQEPDSLHLSIQVVQSPTCVNPTGGILSATARGGTGTLRYKWNTGATTPRISGLSSGVYILTIQDKRGCTKSDTVHLEANSIDIFLLVRKEISCYGLTDGQIFARVSGGISPFSYSWDNGQTTNIASNLGVGMHVVTVVDAKGCTQKDSLFISQPDSLIVNGTIIKEISCYGDSNGAITTSVSGGTAPFKYLWNTSSTLSQLNGIVAGTYTISLTDAYGCSAVDTVVLKEPDSLQLSLKETSSVSCHGGTDATIDIVVKGGTPGYVYAWRSGQSTPGLTNVGAGFYTLTIQDDNNCQVRESISIEEPRALIGTIKIDKEISCFGGSDGEMSVSMLGGTPGYRYSWSSGSSTAFASNLRAGIQVVAVQDSKGCVWTDSLTITEPTALLLSASQTAPASCNGAANGEASVQVSGGSAPYSYLWPDGQTGPRASGLMAGIYWIHVQDSKGCEDSTRLNINNNIPWTLVLTERSSLDCYGDSTASIASQIQSGSNSAPFTYLWSTNETGSTISNLSANTYSLTVTDKDGCEANESLTIAEPDSLQVNFNILQQISCFGARDGSVSARASGGTSPYILTWSNNQTGSTATGLSAGTVSVQVLDAKGCSKSFSLNLTEPDSIGLTLTQIADISCNGASDAAINSLVTGGRSPYLYSWRSGQTTSDIVGITAGTYTLTVTDGSGCSTRKSISIAEPDVLIGTIKIDKEISCFGGSDGEMSVSMLGGTPRYRYSWSSGSSTAFASNLRAGIQVVEVQDSKGCVWTDSLKITEPTALLLSASQTAPASCNGAANGEASIQVSGGSAPYSYLWPDGQTGPRASGLMAGIYWIHVQDSKGCEDSTRLNINNNIPWTLVLTERSSLDCYGDSTASIASQIQSGSNSAPFTYLWSTNETGSTISNLPANTYSLTVTDKDGCEANESLTIVEPDSLTIDILIQSPVSCFEANDASLLSTVSGGSGPYTYFWSNGDTTETASSWSAGVATVTVTDAQGCSKSASINITEPDAIRLQLAQVDPISCNGQSDASILATVAGGNPAYSFVWSNGQITPTSTNLPAGWQMLELTDATGCKIQDSLLLEEPSLITATFSELTSLSCRGDNDAVLQVLASGGTAAYSYLWNTNETTAIIRNLVAGTYSVTITDSQECSVNISYTLAEPNTIIPGASISQDISCFGKTNGALSTNPTGGIAPYTFLWSNSAQTQNISSVGKGIYKVDVTDAAGCTVQDSVELLEPDPLGLTISVLEDVNCQGGMDGTATVSVAGGIPAYTYLWSDGQNTASANNLSAGSYIVTVSDQNSCVDSLDLLIQEPAELLASLTYDQEILCFGDTNGVMSVLPRGGTAPYTYLWSNGATTPRATQLAAGAQSVRITDSKGCVKDVSGFLSEPFPLSAELLIVADISCADAENGSLKVRANGGNLPYSYLWSTGSQDTLISNLTIGSYSVTITDKLGCTQQVDTVLSPPLVISSYLQLTQEIDCYGASNAALDLSIQGGNAPFSFLWQDGVSLQNRTGLSAGLYHVEIRDGNDCVQRDSFLISQPEILQTEVELISDVSCAGLADAIAEVSVEGGVAPYSFLWSNTGNTMRADSLSIGTHYIRISDQNNCFVVDSIEISSPSIIESSIQILEPISCAGGGNGVLLASANGGVGAYSFSWSDGQTDSLATALSSQYYQLTIQDENGCIKTDSMFLPEPDSLSTNISAYQDASCDLAADGAAYVEVSGGVAPYQYNWTNEMINDSLIGVSSGLYKVQITDSLTCTIEDSVFIGQLLPWEASVSILDSVSCYGFDDGVATVSVNGTGNYTFLWSGGQTADTVRTLGAGIQNLEVEDDFGCADTLSLEIQEPDSLRIFAKLVLPSPDMSNGTIEVDSVENGVAPFSYVWSTGATIGKIENLAKGDYEVMLVDTKGCEAYQAFDLDTTSFLWDQFEATADIVRNRVLLEWSTLREIDNKNFTIERSIDNILFESIIETPSGGNSTSRQRYESYDEEPFANKNFYRLKQTFHNGQFSYFSEVREVAFWDNRPGYVFVYPMPLRQGQAMFVELELKEPSDAFIYIFNALGQKVYQTLLESPEGKNTVEIPTSTLSPGLYFLSLSNEQESYMYQMVIY